jgi:hypothetical protein
MPKNGDMAPRAERSAVLPVEPNEAETRRKKNAPVLRQKNSAG